MNISDNCIKLIKEFEGCKLKAYQDVKGIWTIGFGTASTSGVDVHEGLVITEDKAEDYLKQELDSIIKFVNRAVIVPLNQNQFDALIDFVYNAGRGNFSNSTLFKLLNQSNFSDAAEQFLCWNKAGGKVVAGLTRRRQAEKDLFLS